MNNDQLSVNKEDVLRLLDYITQRRFNEDRLSSERTSIFLLSNSFLIAGYIITVTLQQGRPIAYVMGTLGIILSVLQFLLMSWNFRVLNFLFRVQRTLEDHPTLEQIRNEKFLLSAYRDELEGQKFFVWAKRLRLDPHSIAKYWIPIVFFLLWVCLLAFGAVWR